MFMIQTLDGNRGYLAHVDITGPHRVSKYGVSLENIDSIAVPSIEVTTDEDIIVIDEIGKMELFSAAFRDAVIEALESGRCVVGTIMLASHPWADAIKRRPEVEVALVTQQSRHSVAERLARWLQGAV